MSSTLRRAALRAALVLTTTGGILAGLSVAAQAHVEIKPEKVEGGDFAVVAVRVPNERDDASTTRLRLILPTDRPLASVQTTPMPGWQVATKSRRLAKPIDLEGAKVTRVVSEVTWTATGRGVRPGQYQDFALDLGPLPTAGTLTFTALQTYSSGVQVRWNEVSADRSAEPEHPAPTLTLTTPARSGSTTAAPTADESTSGTGPAGARAAESLAAARPDSDTSSALPLGLSAAALLLALVALGLAGTSWRRGRA